MGIRVVIGSICFMNKLVMLLSYYYSESNVNSDCDNGD